MSRYDFRLIIYCRGWVWQPIRARGVRRYESVEWVWARRPRPYEDLVCVGIAV